jgi:metallophosphoesterase (TIGR00282 family)
MKLPVVAPKPAGCVRLMFFGDSVGQSGREAMMAAVRAWKTPLQADWVVANGENAAGGFGITKGIYQSMREAGVDVVTTGNHVWDQKETLVFIGDTDDRLLRPLNLLPGAPGVGMVYVPDPAPGLVVINVMGRVHMPTVDDPFRAARSAVEAARERTPLIFVDFHAEATGEKMAFARYLDGLASGVVGTHTHVQTADERILPEGTAFLTDAGMCGPYDSCIGMDVAVVIRKTLSGLPERYTVASGVAQVNGAILDLDRSTGRAVALHRINQLAAPEPVAQHA